MKTSKLDADTSPDDLTANGDMSKNIRDKDKDACRRYMDAISSKGRALNLDRRVIDRDRRIGIVSQYNGHSRREIIDRRESAGDRRG